MSSKNKIITVVALPVVILFLFTSLLYAEPKGNPPGPKGGPGAGPDRMMKGNPTGPKSGPGVGQRFDRDNNPPGPKGGPGTDWENPPGPKGGPGAGPDTMQEKAVVDKRWEKAADANKDGIVDQTEIHRWRQGRLNRDDNTSSESQGYSDASPDTKQEKAVVDKEWEKAADANKDGMVDQTEIQQWKQGRPDRLDKDNNPPGPKGGPGTDWENPPGPKGGPGASPDRVGPKGNPPGPKGGPGAGPSSPKGADRR